MPQQAHVEEPWFKEIRALCPAEYDIVLKRLGDFYSLCIYEEGWFSHQGNATVAITDEKLLAKLRSINGQYIVDGLPVFYFEH